MLYLSVNSIRSYILLQKSVSSNHFEGAIFINHITIKFWKILTANQQKFVCKRLKISQNFFQILPNMGMTQINSNFPWIIAICIRFQWTNLQRWHDFGFSAGWKWWIEFAWHHQRWIENNRQPKRKSQWILESVGRKGTAIYEKWKIKWTIVLNFNFKSWKYSFKEFILPERFHLQKSGSSWSSFQLWYYTHFKYTHANFCADFMSLTEHADIEVYGKTWECFINWIWHKHGCATRCFDRKIGNMPAVYVYLRTN